jgi:GTPase Era involved in 16S rRNA processing
VLSLCSDYLNQKHGDRVESAWSIASDADATLLVVDAYRQFHKPDWRIIELIQDFRENLVKLQQRDRRIVLVMTKMDQFAKDSARNVTEMIENLSSLAKVDSTFAVSALRGIITFHRKHDKFVFDQS